jgi:hypothetical protein
VQQRMDMSPLGLQQAHCSHTHLTHRTVTRRATPARTTGVVRTAIVDDMFVSGLCEAAPDSELCALFVGAYTPAPPRKEV